MVARPASRRPLLGSTYRRRLLFPQARPYDAAMSRAARAALRALPVGAGGALFLVASASPAAAHNVSAGSMPAPPWLLAYAGVFAVAAAAVYLRATWTRARLVGPAGPTTAGGPLGPGSPDGPAADIDDDPHLGGHPLGLERRPHPTAGGLVGVLLFGLALVAAIVGPDSAAANIAPVAVLVVWWVLLPLLSLVVGDVMHVINPFVAVVSVLDRTGAVDDRRRGPDWTGAAFLFAFLWFFLAYHRPGSPRSLAVFLVAYAVAAVAGGLVWGRRWLSTGEGFGALSSAVALFSPLRHLTTRPPGLGALMVVWLGGTVFDAFSFTEMWGDVLGSSIGWERTILNTVGLVWVIAVVAGVYLTALRLAERRMGGDGEGDGPRSLAGPLALCLVPLATGWFLAHDLTLLLFEGQNFLALLSDPIGEGWNLLGTISNTIDYGIVQAGWVPWTQILLLLAGHLVAVVVAHDRAIGLLGARRGIYVTWSLAGATALSVAAAALLVLG